MTTTMTTMTTRPITTTAKWLIRLIWLATAILWIAMFILTHTPVALPVRVVTNDKTAHFLGYLALGSALFASLRLGGRRDPTLAVLAVGLIYGGIDELLQIPVGRSSDWNDWFADAAGVAVAVTIGGCITRWIDRRAERSSW